MKPEKPPYGTPCNGCGLCCQVQLCPLAQIALPRAVAPCPALEMEGDRFTCGLIQHPEKYAPIRTSVYGVDAMREAASLGVGAGIGCDAKLENEPDAPPPEYRKAIERERRMPRYRRLKIMNLWQSR